MSGKHVTQTADQSMQTGEKVRLNGRLIDSNQFCSFV